MSTPLLLRLARHPHVKAALRCTTCKTPMGVVTVGKTRRYRHLDGRWSCPTPPGLVGWGETWANLKGKQEVE